MWKPFNSARSTQVGIRILFRQPDGSQQDVQVPVGTSLLFAAQDANVSGIVGECGSGLTCATCHVWVDPTDLGRLPPPGPAELDMLDFVTAERRPGSRLSCQLVATEGLEGLQLQVPDRQY